MTVGIQQPPIYSLKLPAVAWQLLWWLLCKADGNLEVKGGWRTQAARELGHHNVWIGKCVAQLADARLIEAPKSGRTVRVLARNIR